MNIHAIAQTLEDRFTLQKFSWSGLAKKLDIKEYKILDARRKPVPGRVYDPENNNYGAIATIITRDDNALDLFYRLTDQDFEQLATKQSTSSIFLSLDDISINDKLFLWNAPKGQIQVSVLKITDTHIACANTETSQLYAWSHTTFKNYGPSDLTNTQKTTPEAP